jgi:hypothetical protein
MPEVPKSSKRTLIILCALFFVPLASSFILYYVIGWRPSGGTNHGELLQPIRQLPADLAGLLKGDGSPPRNWALVYVGDGACDEDCRRALVFARQTRLSLNKDMSRVNWGLLATANCCDLTYLDREHKGMKVYAAGDDAGVQELFDLLPAVDLRYSLFVIDPLGNIVMRYDVRQPPRGLLEDLKKMLKLSHIG